MRAKLLTLSLLTLSLALAGHRAAHADASTEAALRASLQSATAQIAQLEDQVANLQASQAPDVATIEALRAQLKTQQAGGGPEDKAKAAAAKAEQEKQLAALRTALGQSQSAYQAASSQASSTASENSTLKAQLATLQSGLSTCQDKNAQLYKLGNQILDAYSHKDDVLSGFVDHEPFIGFKRVQLQNIVQDEQDKLDANQLTPPAPNP